MTDFLYLGYFFVLVLGIETWLHPKLKQNWNNIEDFVTNERPFPPSIWAYLYFFAELAHHFGWNVFKKVFQMYKPVNSDGETPENDKEKEDLFYINFSRQVNDCTFSERKVAFLFSTHFANLANQ